jgi:radical SAM protein with 4Fe4S-binding SPASM domain
MRYKWFTLNKDVFLVKGAKRGALYDLKKGSVYSINERSTEIIDKCEKGNSLKNIAKKENLPINEILKYLKKLQILGLGQFVDKKEKLVKKILPSFKKYQLGFIWLEITEKCNLKCLHCYNEGDRTTAEENLTLKDWIGILKEAKKLGCKNCQFIGGEPFLCQENLFYLISVAKRLGYKFIEIFTNATLLNESILKRVAKLRVNLAISLYANRPAIHDQITQVKGSFGKTSKAIKIAKKLNIPLRIAVIIMKQNQNSAKETLNFLKKELHIRNIGYDVVRPSGRGCNSNLIPAKNIRQLSLRKTAKFPKFTKEDFLRRRFGHNCFVNRVCITASGNVIPCIMKRNEILGNLKEKSLRQILYSKKGQEFIRLSKDHIEVCKDCEYRYACFDCRVKTNDAENLYAKSSDCFYNPYTGIWEQKEVRDR